MLGTFLDDRRVKKLPFSLVSRWLDHPYIWVFLEHISSYVQVLIYSILLLLTYF